MVKEKQKEKKTKSPKKTKQSNSEEPISIEKFSLQELFEKHKVKPLQAVGFLGYYGLSEYFKKEFKNDEYVIKFSEGEFNDMYRRYIEREI